VWYPDSAVASHMAPTEGNLLSKSAYTGTQKVQVGIKHVGYLQIPTVTKPLVLNNALHVPSLKHNLLSVKQLCKDNNCVIVFDNLSVCVKDKTSSNVLLYASSTGNVYPLHVPDLFPKAFVALIDPATTWHRRLGHCGVRTLSFLKTRNLVSFSNKFHDSYDSCWLTKSHRLPFQLVEHCCLRPLDLIHSY